MKVLGLDLSDPSVVIPLAFIAFSCSVMLCVGIYWMGYNHGWDASAQVRAEELFPKTPAAQFVDWNFTLIGGFEDEGKQGIG